MAEIREIDRFLARASVGLAGLILEGAPGIGKTRLWRYGLSLAERRGLRTLVARPAAADAAFEFGGLTDLFSDVPKEAFAALPRLQRVALEIALLRADVDIGHDGGPLAEGVDERVLAAAVLSLLRLLAREAPLVVAVDDLQWLDQRSARLLGFAGRRLERDHVGFVLTLRLGDAGGDRGGEAADPVVKGLDPDLLTHLQLGPLSVAALHEVIRVRTGLALHRPTLLRIHEVSGGNPFYAIQLAQAFAVAGERRLAGEALPVPHDLEELVGGRLDAVTPGAQSMLLYLAALPRPTVPNLARVVEDPARLDAQLDEAVEAGIVELDGPAVHFSHPLLGTIHYRRAHPARRRAVHSRIAEAAADRELRAYHLALAAAGPDEHVAAELELAASGARARGARDQALELLEHALAATPSADVAAIRRRLVAVADAAFEAGDAGRARELLERVRASLRAGPERAEILLRLGVVAQTDDFDRSVDLLRAAARARALAPGARIGSAAAAPKAGGRRRARRGSGDLRAAAGTGLGRSGATGGGPHRRSRRAFGRGCRRAALCDRARDRGLRPGGTDESGDRGRPPPQSEDRRVEPHPDLPEARRSLSDGAGSPRRARGALRDPPGRLSSGVSPGW